MSSGDYYIHKNKPRYPIPLKTKAFNEPSDLVGFNVGNGATRAYFLTNDGDIGTFRRLGLRVTFERPIQYPCMVVTYKKGMRYEVAYLYGLITIFYGFVFGLPKSLVKILSSAESLL